MKVEIRNEQAIIEGYVNVVERKSKPIRDIRGSFVEKVSPGTFSNALKKNNNVELRYNHKRKLGDQKDGSLELREDNVGLYAKAIVSDAEVVKKARNKKLRGWSFGFIKNRDKWDKEGDVEVRELEDIQLTEVSILDINPAYLATTINVRSDNEEELTEHRACLATDDDIQYVEERVADDDNSPKEEPLNQKYKDVITELKGKGE